MNRRAFSGTMGLPGERTMRRAANALVLVLILAVAGGEQVDASEID